MRAAVAVSRSGWRERSRAAFASQPVHCPSERKAGAAVSRVTSLVGACQRCTSGVCDSSLAPPARRQLPQLSFHRRRLHSSSTSCSSASLCPAIVPVPANLDVSAASPVPSVGGLFGSTNLRQPADFARIAAATQQRSADTARYSTQHCHTPPRIACRTVHRVGVKCVRLHAGIESLSSVHH